MSHKPKPDMTKLTDAQIYNRVKALSEDLQKLKDAAAKRGSIEVPKNEDTYFLDNMGFWEYWQPSVVEWTSSSSNC